MLEISKMQWDQIHGGHGAGIFGTLLLIPHTIELYNIIADFGRNGCRNLDERSYFVQDVCGIINYMTKNNGSQEL